MIHNVADSDEDVIDDIKRYLSYFPSSAWSYPTQRPADESHGAAADTRTARHRLA